MHVKNNALKRIINIIYYVFVLSCLVYGIGSITYATASQDSGPDVTVIINKNGEYQITGDLFGNELWYPGKAKHGIIRIVNHYKDANINNLSLNVVINSFKDGLNKDLVYNSFINNMRLTIEKGKLLFFNRKIVEDTTLADLLANGINFAEASKIDMGNSMDFKYTLKMDGNATDELESMSANIDFIFNTNEVPGSENDGSNGNNSDN
ncbi:MAG: hypothetical protein ACOYJ1_16895 [Peptococcales bacterium]|jgi:hypothetical protein